jgi:soluble lytic murein transglycosylase-like protein
MIPGVRVWLLMVVLVSLMIARAVPADEGIARRLAALKMLSTTTAVSAALPAAPPSGDTHCGNQREAWWRLTRYGVRSRIDAAVRDASLLYRTDRRLIESVIRVESNYDVDAVSYKGAMGLMQLMPGTARDLGVICAFEPRSNVLAGTRYLRRLRDQLGSWPRALAGYHAGPRRVESGRIPAITHRYVANVMRRWKPGARASLEKP